MTQTRFTNQNVEMLRNPQQRIAQNGNSSSENTSWTVFTRGKGNHKVGQADIKLKSATETRSVRFERSLNQKLYLDHCLAIDTSFKI